MIQPFPWDRIPRYDAAQAAATNQCARLAGARGIDVAGDLREMFAGLGFETLELNLAHIAAHRGAIFQPELGLGYATNFFVPGVGAHGAVAVDHSLVTTALTTIGGAPGVAVALDDWDFGLVTWLLLRVLGVLAGAGAPPVTLVAGRRPPERIAEEVAGPWVIHELVVDVRLDGQRGWARIFLPDATLAHLLQNATPPPLAATPAAFRVPLALRLVAGTARLTRNEVTTLSPGDVVLFDAHGVKTAALEPTSGGRVALGGHWLEAEVAFEQGRWQFGINDITPRGDRAMSGESMTTTQLGADAVLAVEAVVGRTTMTFSDIARLKPGQILVADRSIGEPIDIVVGGAVVARGELVDVEGRLGVRVLTLGSE